MGQRIIISDESEIAGFNRTIGVANQEDYHLKRPPKITQVAFLGANDVKRRIWRLVLHCVVRQNRHNPTWSGCRSRQTSYRH
jgi:hypothetical protein